MTAPAQPTAADIGPRLTAVFDPEEVRWKAQTVKGNRALAVAYIDARVIQDRLDEVLGVDGWQDEYLAIDGGSVMCRLRLRIGGEWVTKVDVGSPSEQPDGGDRMKAAFSDALKRAAVKFGIGRYLYRLPMQWVDYDPVKKQFARKPNLPPWALPGGAAQATPAKPAAREQAPAPAATSAPAPAANGVLLLPPQRKELADLLRASGVPSEDFFAAVGTDHIAKIPARLHAVCVLIARTRAKPVKLVEWLEVRTLAEAGDSVLARAENALRAKLNAPGGPS